MQYRKYSRPIHSSKSAQITAFMIIGILMLFVTGVVLYTRFQLQERPEFVPEHLEPLKEYIEQCMYTSASDAALRLGRTGGYLYYPLEIERDPSTYLNATVRMPYWYDGREYITKSDIGSQIERYVDETVLSCLDNLSTFRNQYDITILDAFETEVDLQSDSFMVRGTFPLLIKNRREFSENRITQFTSEVNLPVGRAFEKAQKLIALENRLQFLENNTLDMIASSQLPFIGGDLNCSPQVWSIEEDIKPQIKSMIIANNKFYTFEDTVDSSPEGPYQNYYQEFYHFDLNLRRNTGSQIDIVYDPRWNTFGMDGMELDVYPNRAGVVEPAYSQLPFSLCINLYNHKYSLDYPVVFRIIEPAQQFAGADDYVFSFATKVVIDDNQPARRISRSDPTNLDTYSIQEICNTTEKTVRIYTYDFVTGNSLQDVSLDYQCARLLCRDIGNTQLPRQDGLVLGYQAYTDADLPQCLNGILIAEKEGYVREIQERISVGDFTRNGVEESLPGDSLDIYLTPLQELNLSITVREYGASQLGEILDAGEASVREMKESEMAILSIRNDEIDYDASIYYTPGEDPHFINQDTYANSFLLPARDLTYTLDFKLLDENEMVGGLLGNFTVKSEEVIEAKGIEINVVRKHTYPFNRAEAIRELMELLEEHETTYRPTFIRS